MKYNICFTLTAKQYLLEIASFLKENYGQKTAEKIINEIKEKIKSLSQFPNRGINPKDTLLKSFEIKFIISGHYLIFYRVNEERKMVNICGIFDGRMQYKKFLNYLKTDD